jgi:tryptophan-rich sensory protein
VIEDMDATTPVSARAAARPPAPDRPHAYGLLGFMFAACFGAAAIGGAATGPEIEGWYRTLAKPWFNPPDWLFGPVWTVLFAVMALVGWQIARTPATDEAGRAARRLALVAFFAQLGLNVGWSIVFFGLHSVAGGMVVTTALWAAILWTILAARRVIGQTVFWLLPYLAWVSFASLLNAAILALN